MTSNDVTIESDGIKLAGTVSTPEGSGPFPTVLMIHGSGPVDRNENMPSQKLDVFNVIADHLAQIGVASLRYDKRGCGQSEGDYYVAGHNDLIADATRCLDYLKECEFCDETQTYLLGHSEGCIISPQMCPAYPEIAGLILLCPFVDDLESILLKQAKKLQQDFEGPPGVLRPARMLAARIFGATVNRQKHLIKKLQTTKHDLGRYGLHKINGKALREMLALDPPAIFDKVDCPILIIGGAKDIQCEPEDVHRIADIVHGPTSAHVIEDLTHVLRYDTEEPNFLSTPKLLSKPIEPEVTDLICKWLQSQAD